MVTKRSNSKPPSTHPDAQAKSATQRLAAKMKGTDGLARAFPFNAIKADEIGRKGALNPPQGKSRDAPSTDVSASTLAETNANDKTGGAAAAGENPNNAPLEKVRVDSSGRALTTNQGVAIANNQSSLKAGLRGPTLLEDFILREKITHFDHERIPERIVHARGSAAHGYFECTEALTDLTMAAPLLKSASAPRVRALFDRRRRAWLGRPCARCTWLCGQVLHRSRQLGPGWQQHSCFLIQDAMKFPDLVHSVKPEPHHAMPQAASAHDTFWDFASLMPEITHMLMWVMSDRAIPAAIE
jgi:catalase